MEKNNSNNLFTVIIGMLSQFIWKFNTLLVNSENKFNELYSRYPLIRRPTDVLSNIKKSIVDYFDNSLKEPPFDCWSGLYQIEQNNKLNYVYHIKSLKDISELNDRDSSYTPFLLDIKEKNKVCVISKFNDYFKVFFTKNNDIATTDLSQRTFLSVFYNHPSMMDSIQINIPEKMMLVGNELFNATFILRCLHLTNEHYIFDDKYTIQIMDSEIDEYNIKYGQYLYINKDTFELKSI